MEGVSQPYGYQSCLFHCKKLKGESFAFIFIILTTCELLQEPLVKVTNMLVTV